MNAPIKQHLIDPEICIRCYTCEMTCPIEAITHDDNNVVVDNSKCDQCMDCIPVCPTGSIDNWRVVETAYTVEEQLEWMELPEQEAFESAEGDNTSDTIEALDDSIAALLQEAHSGTGGKSIAPSSASKPTINLHNLAKPAVATVKGNYRLTEDNDHDVRHIILDLGNQPFPVLEGQSVGIIPPGTDDKGNPLLPRLYSVSSPRDGERPNFNNLSLTVKREAKGICSNYLCDLTKDDEIKITGPFGATFLLPDDPDARLLMICTGTGAAPMRAFTMRRERTVGNKTGGMLMFFGARTPEALPYFGPLQKLPASLIDSHLVYSRSDNKQYVQQAMLQESEKVATFLSDASTHIYLCGLRDMEAGVNEALSTISGSIGETWDDLRERLRSEGRYHVETY